MFVVDENYKGKRYRDRILKVLAFPLQALMLKNLYSFNITYIL